MNTVLVHESNPGSVLERLELERTGSQHIRVAGNPLKSSAKATSHMALKPMKGCDPAPLSGAGATRGHGEGKGMLRVRCHDVNEL